MKLDIKLDLKKILETDNIATLLSEPQLNSVSDLVKETYKTDSVSCKDEFISKSEVMDLAMQDVIPKEGKPNSVIPLIYASAQRFNADAYPALMRDGEIVKAKVLGKDDAVYQKDAQGNDIINPETQQKEEVLPAGHKLRKAERIAEFENYLLNNHLSDWQGDEDKLLFSCAILGDMFKKTYYDDYKNKIVSELIYPLDIIVNINATNMEEFAVSQKLKMSQNEVRQRMLTGEYIKYDIELLKYDKEDQEDREKEEEEAEYDQPIELIEQHRLLDLDGDGYKEPYIVILGGDKVLKITRRFDEVDITYLGKEVLEIKGNNYYTHRIFIPNPKGTFYGLGYGYILKKINKTVNGSVNQLMQAAINANMTRGFISTDLKMKGGNLSLQQNEWKMVSSPGVDIRNNIVPMDSKEPSIVLFNLMTFLIDTGKALSGITDVLGGNIPANMQPTTALASIEQGLKEFKAIYKRMHRSLTEEIKKIHKIIANMPERFAEEYLQVLDDNEANFENDFNDETLDIQLTADTDVVTNIERVAKSNFLMQFRGDPQINQYELAKRILTPMNVENIDDLVIEPQPSQPDPTIEMLKIQQQIEAGKLQVAIQDSNRQLAEAAAKAKTMDSKILEVEVKAEKSEAEVEKLRAETMQVLSQIENEKEKLKLEADALYQPKNQPSKMNEEKSNERTEVD
jgi:hypothetical protein